MTGCDGFMIARAAQGNPWIFSQILESLSGAQPPDERETPGGAQPPDEREIPGREQLRGAGQNDEKWEQPDFPAVRRPRMEEVAAMILRHARMQLDLRGEYIGIRQMRKHASWYMAGYPHAAELRSRINAVESYGELEALLRELAP